ncbi:hypothetical protein GOA55_10360 [Sinorhizobium meliloti]|nr:hypothetical protein [Sinorhizobium meliloti]
MVADVACCDLPFLSGLFTPVGGRSIVDFRLGIGPPWTLLNATQKGAGFDKNMPQNKFVGGRLAGAILMIFGPLARPEGSFSHEMRRVIRKQNDQFTD